LTDFSAHLLTGTLVAVSFRRWESLPCGHDLPIYLIQTSWQGEWVFRKCDVREAFIDATFAAAKKGGRKVGKYMRNSPPQSEHHAN
jgi:hypothetical protein